ncbi:hypothetical protein TI39_contig67g00001, partial [Zymoseptoria brevis]
MLHSPHMNGSPQHCDEEQPSTSVSPRNSRYAATASNDPASLPAGEAQSDRDVSPHYLYSSSLTRSSSPSPATSSVYRPSRSHPPEMAIRLAYHLEPEWSRPYGKIDVSQTSAEPELPTVISLPPQELPEKSHIPAAPSIFDEDRQTVTPLHEISRLLRQQKYHKSRSRYAEERLRYLQIAAARTNRLTCASRSVQHTLAECIKTEDKNSFVNLLHAFHDATDDILQASVPSTGSEHAKSSHGSFLEDPTPSSRTTVLDLMSKVRHDGPFLADQLENLSQKELVALLPDWSSLRPNDSIFASSQRNSSRNSRPLGFVVDAQVDLVSSYSYCSPLETLIFGTQSLSTFGQISDTRATDVWSTVCARLISTQKPGSERLVPAVLDIWASFVPWPGKDRLETWILETLNRGSFLLDLSSRHTFKARIEGRTEAPAEEELRTEAFYSRAVNGLLDLLADTSSGSVLPPGALTLARTIFDKLADCPGHQRGLPQFLITRWLSSSFLMDAVTLPEAYGLLTDHYISEPGRQRILREVVVRVQKAIYEVAYSWRHGSNATMDMTRRVSAVMSRFQPQTTMGSQARPTSDLSHSGESSAETFIALTAKDILTSLNALFPQRRPASMLSDFDSSNSNSGLRSSASSVSGFSLFSHARTPDVYSPISGLLSSESQPAMAPPPDIPNPEISSGHDSLHIQEARLELEDLLANGDPASWDILVIAPGSNHFQTLREISSQNVRVPESRGHGSSTGLTEEQTRLKKNIKKLLNGCDTGMSAASGNIGELLSTVRTQLESMLERQIQAFEAQSDFVGAHAGFQQLHDFRQLTSSSLDSLRDVLVRIESTARQSAIQSEIAEKRCEKWTRLLKPMTDLQTFHLEPLTRAITSLRDKMCHTSHVRPSAAYDAARSIACALRIMGKSRETSSFSARTRLGPPLRHWPASKTTTNNLHLKSEAQVLELLSAKVEHCGPNKLSDEQSRLTETWLEKMGIDNLCRGEERLHRLCMEVRKVVDGVLNASPEHSMISSNTLFARDGELIREMTRASTASTAPKHGQLSSLYAGNRRSGISTLQTQLRGVERPSSRSQALSNTSSRDYLDARSPTLTSKSSNPFWSPAMTEVSSPGSATSVGSARTEAALEYSSHKQGPGGVHSAPPSALEKLRQRLTALVLSDLAANLFTEGSETDTALWNGLGWTLVGPHFNTIQVSEPPQQEQTQASHGPTATPPFDFLAAFSRLFQKFSASSNPSTKFTCLHDIDRLLTPYMFALNPALARSPPSDLSVTAFRHLFTHPTLFPSGPRTIFRDLQYIASLLPASTISPTTPPGQSFTHATLALLSLRSSARTLFVETADAIIAYHSNNRPGSSAAPHPPSPAQAHRDEMFSSPSTSTTSLPGGVAQYSLSDASHLLSIAAREGDAVAQRELATLYLTHPATTPLILAPFARTGEVFREEIESKWRSGGRGKGNDREKCDPGVMCVAYFWMGRSARGGDGVAKRVLEQGSE